MCPSPPLPIDEISVYWTEEELFTWLDKMICGSNPPRNVTPDVNPFIHKPSDLPRMRKEAETGSWKSIGDACRIFTNSVTTGWRTTYKYYECPAPSVCKTDWVMQEYRLTKEIHENSWPKDAGSLCRVFPSHVQSPNNEMQQNLASIQNMVSGESITSILSELLGEESNRNGKGFPSRSDVNSRVDETNTVPMTEELLNHPVENLPEMDGDFLEMLDLANPVSPSSSSENSSCLSMTSDEYFDSIALLRDLEAEDQNDHQRKNADCKFSILASARPNEVVMHLATAGSLTSSDGNKTPVETLKTRNSPPVAVTEQKFHDNTVVKPRITSWNAENNIGGPSSKSLNVAASSSGHKAALERKKEAITGKTKLKKFCCFMPF